FGWKSMFLIGGVPGLIVTFFLSRLPESPRWLISKGRFEEAEEVIARMGPSPAAARRPLPEGEALSPWERATAEGSRVRVSSARELLGPTYRSRTLIAWTLWATAFFVTNSMNNWLPSLYTTVYHLQLRESLRAASM